MDSWLAFRESAIRQWRGLSEEERVHYEASIAARERYGASGCLFGGSMVRAQLYTPIWSVEHRPLERVTLMGVKEDLRHDG